MDMPDSITPANLPPGYPAYLGYVDGEWETASELKQRFPGARVLTLTVTGSPGEVADGCDIENGDLSPESGAAWAADRVASRPVLYASVSAMPGIIKALAAHGVARGQVRLLSAHYDAGKHICGPATCKYPGIDSAMDGTQWTDEFEGARGSRIDMSELAAGFFGEPVTTSTWEDDLMASIQTIQKGATGQAVKNWQGLLVARGYGATLGTSGPRKDGVDGQFGAATDKATRALQDGLKVTGGADGVVGEHSWSAALDA
jgi:hypothetical protein